MWAWFWVVFHNNQINIDLSGNWRAGGERGPKTAYFTSKPCPDMLRTLQWMWSQHCRNCEIEPQSGYNPARKLFVYALSGKQLGAVLPVRFPWRSLILAWVSVRVSTWTEARALATVANTTWRRRKSTELLFCADLGRRKWQCPDIKGTGSTSHCKWWWQLMRSYGIRNPSGKPLAVNRLANTKSYIVSIMKQHTRYFHLEAYAPNRIHIPCLDWKFRYDKNQDTYACMSTTTSRDDWVLENYVKRETVESWKQSYDVRGERQWQHDRGDGKWQWQWQYWDDNCCIWNSNRVMIATHVPCGGQCMRLIDSTSSAGSAGYMIQREPIIMITEPMRIK